MSELEKKYKQIIKNVEDKLQNEENSKYVKSQMDQLILDVYSEIEAVKANIDEMVVRQNNAEQSFEKVKKIVDSIAKDIYMDNDEYDLEIICPYCNYSFILDSDDIRDEVECPECNNTIEIDWNGESLDSGKCSSGCESCGHHCGDEEKEEENENEDDM